MTLGCVNRGGPDSVIRIDAVRALEQAVPLTAAAVAALESWQARAGEIVTLVDGGQTCYRARIVELGPSGGVVVPFARLPQAAESPLAIEIYQALPEKERFELVLQKLTELGVSRIVPLTSQRSATLEERDAGQKKSHRWPDVVLRAAKQCRRAMVPELYPVLSWDEATYLAQHAELKLMLYEGEEHWTLREALGGLQPLRIALLVGPEGGFTAEEVADARRLGFLPVSLGPRILRTETAAIVGAAALQYAAGDLA